MKISQIANATMPSKEDLPPLQGMLLEEMRRRNDEVFESSDEGLLRSFPSMKRSALSWTLWSLEKRGLVKKIRVRMTGRLTTVFGVPEAVEQLQERLSPSSKKEPIIPAV